MGRLDELKNILEDHRKWLSGEPGGTRANLAGANLTRASLTGADLAGACLAGADLTGADLTGADMADSYLTGASLTGANLTGANLARAILTGANLRGAILAGACLTGAKILAPDRREITLAGNALQISGSMHLFTAICRDVVQIGCIRQTLAWWLEHSVRAGDENGYRPPAIAEYRLYLELADRLLPQ